MKWYRVSAFILSFLVASSVSAEVGGLWKTHRGVSGGYLYVNIAYCGENSRDICGKIARAFDADGNVIPDYIFLDKLVLKNMQPIRKNFWGKGRLWSPENERYYSGKVRFLEKSKSLKVSGCIGIPCLNFYWKKVKN